jgi:hypothetical protein
MLKKSITYDDYNGDTRTEDFYFNFTKLELLELDVKFDGGIEGHVNKLTQTDNGKDAYFLFKDIVLSAYGVKSEDGKHFEKSQALRDQFESSPALSELIFGFLVNPSEGAAFVEACLPAKLVAEAKALAASKSDQPELPLPGAPKYPTLVEDVKHDDGLTQKQLSEMSQAELIELLAKKNGE